MKEVIRNSLGFEVPILFYESPEEADAAAGPGVVGAYFTEADNNLYYRSGAAQEAREIIADVVEKETNVEREARPVMKDGKPVVKDGEEVLEYVLAEEPYVKMALAKSGRTAESLKDAVIEACRQANEGKGIAVDIKKRERKSPTPKKLAARFVEAAKQVIAGGADKLAEVNKRMSKLIEKQFTATGESDKDLQALGALIKEYSEAFEKQAMQKLMA